VKRRAPLLVMVSICVALGFVLAIAGSVIVALAGGMFAAAIGAIALRALDAPQDPGRRRFLGLIGGLGAVAAIGGSALGAAAERLLRPDPGPALESMARRVGADNLELVLRQYHPGRSGDLQLLLAPFNSSNYPQESVSLVKNDPRSSHAQPWMYLERVPIVVWAPGIVAPGDRTERVTLADIAPSIATLIGFEGFDTGDGNPLPGLATPATPPKVVVTFVIDGGGWNVLGHWPNAWPGLKALMGDGVVYRNAIMGSFPAVTACAHATIGTGVFPRTHGITGHNVRRNGHPVKAWGEPGHVDPSFLLVPTLAERWSEETNDRAWIGEIGYQVWHVGMLGRGGRPLGELPVGVYWDEDHSSSWRSHNPELYRLPKSVPPRGELDAKTLAYHDPHVDDRFSAFAPGKKAVCCTPPIIEYQGDLIEAAFDSEEIGTHDATDLLYVNYKAPDYTGHVYNFLSMRERFALEAVDHQLTRLATMLQERFTPGEFAMIVLADHGQCPTVNLAGGVRLDPIQIQADLEREFGRSLFDIVEAVVPSEIYLSEAAMLDAGISRDDVAAFLRDYRYGENIGPYVHADAIDPGRFDREIFAAVMPTTYLDRLRGTDLSRFGAGEFGGDRVDPAMPPITW
jgi:arylsulfatase A-like enzyme